MHKYIDKFIRAKILYIQYRHLKNQFSMKTLKLNTFLFQNFKTLILAKYHARNMSCFMTKPTKWHVRPAKTQISLGIHPVGSEPSLCAQWVAKDPSFLHADSEDSDQTGRMPRLI